MLFSRKKTPPRSSNFKVQKHLNQMTRMTYHQSRAAHHVILAKEPEMTENSVYAGYLRDLSKGNRADQKTYSVLKDRVREDVAELYGIRNLPAKFNQKDSFPSKVELHL